MIVHKEDHLTELRPETLIDVALIPTPGETPISPETLVKAILPPPQDLTLAMSSHSSQSADNTLPITDPLVLYNPDYTPSAVKTSNFDVHGRSKAARYAEAVLLILRADRKLVSTEPQLLQIGLKAMVLAQDALAVPGASRGLFSPSIRTDTLEGIIRDAEGALSYALASLDDAPLAWHTATVQTLKSGKAPLESDFLQAILEALRGEIATSGSDVAARVFRDILSRHLRQSGAGEAEAEIWLNYAMQLLEKGRM
jgi:hypothetical protein